MNNQFFELEDTDNILSFFNINGYVVVRVLTDEECKTTIDGINKMMKDKNEKFDIHDVSTYHHVPVKRGFPVLGKQPIFDRTLLINRCHPNVHRLFSLLYGREDLLCNHDRVGFFRPTKGIEIDGKIVDRDGWRSDYEYPSVHLDFNPTLYLSDKVREDRSRLTYTKVKDFLSENNMYSANMGDDSASPHMQLQGVLNLLDNDVSDGDFRCIPGFVRRFDEWREGLFFDNNRSYARYEFSADVENDAKYLDVKKISCPAGCMIVWDQRLAHGTDPNNSNHPRLIQYLRLFPSSYLTEEVRGKRRKALRSRIERKDLIGLDTRTLDL